jgi:hypothetical protein
VPPPRRPSELCPDFDPELERVIMRSLDADPEARYQSAREMRADVLALFARTSELDDRPVLAECEARPCALDDSGAAENDAHEPSAQDLEALQRKLRRRRAVPAVISVGFVSVLICGMAWQLSPHATSQAMETLAAGMASLLGLLQP